MKKYKNAVIFLCVALALISLLALTFSFSERANGDGEQKSKKGDKYNFLLLGSDRVSGLTDVIMIVSVDTENQNAHIVQIPRDTYAEYTEKSYKKLNGAVFALGGEENFCKFLSKNFCIKIDGYFHFDLDTFVKTVDMIGGVEVDLPFDMVYKDPYQDLEINLKKGVQVLDGKSAEQFIRYRKGYVRGDIDRINAQKIFMAAFVKKVKELSFTKTVKVIVNVVRDIKTDVPLNKLVEITASARKIGEDKIFMATLGGNDVRTGKYGAWYYVISKSSAVKILSEFTSTPIDKENFDKMGLFVNSKNKEFLKIYNSEAECETDSADNINENGASIQKR